jgi:hypothetical protein
VVVAAVATVLVAGGDQVVNGRAAAAGESAVPLRTRDGWTTLSNPVSGLSYQVPPTHWSTNPANGTVGQITLAQGAERTAYTCGKPVERLLRGVLGSGSAPKADPGSVATAVAQSAATQYYSTGPTPPSITIGPVVPVTRRTGAGVLVSGALVRAIVSQHADPCLAARGEVLVLVLRLADRDGVLVVNGDVAGGPSSPAPATDGELMSIVDTARPTT